MSLYGAFARDRYLDELNFPRDTQEGVLSPATQRLRMSKNLSGASVVSDAITGFGFGTAASPIALGAATSGNGINFNFTASNTTGTLSGLRVGITGAGGGTQTIFGGRFNATITGTTGTAEGLRSELTLSGASGQVSVSSAALSSEVANDTAKTVSAALYNAQFRSNFVASTVLHQASAFMRFVNLGAVSFTRWVELPNAASAALLAPHITDAMTHSIRIRTADNTLYYIMATTTATNRTGGA